MPIWYDINPENERRQWLNEQARQTTIWNKYGGQQELITQARHQQNGALVSRDAARCNEEDIFKIPDIADFSSEKIRALTSRDALALYDLVKQKGGVIPNFEQLKAINDPELIRALTSHGARMCYERSKAESSKVPNFEQLKAINDPELI